MVPSYKVVTTRRAKVESTETWASWRTLALHRQDPVFSVGFPVENFARGRSAAVSISDLNRENEEDRGTDIDID